MIFYVKIQKVIFKFQPERSRPMEHNTFSDITPEILRLAKKSEEAGIIDSELYTRYDVKRGLRDINGKGVLAGLTHISDVRATEIKDGVSVPAHGKLFTAATMYRT